MTLTPEWKQAVGRPAMSRSVWKIRTCIPPTSGAIRVRAIGAIRAPFVSDPDFCDLHEIS